MSGCFLCKHAQPRFQHHPKTGKMLVACGAQDKDVSEIASDCPYFEEHTAASLLNSVKIAFQEESV